MKSFLDNVNPNNYFVLKNGFMIRSLPELSSALEHIDNEIFNHHVNFHKNDFSNWIGHVIGDNYLKNSLMSVDNKEDFISILNSRISDLQSNSDTQEKFDFDVPLEGDVLSNVMGDTTFTNMSMAEAVAVQQEAPPDQMTNSPPEADLPDELPTELPPDMPPEISEEPTAQPVSESPTEEKPSETVEEASVEEKPAEVVEEKPIEEKPEEPVIEENKEEVNEEITEKKPSETVEESPAEDKPTEVKEDEKTTEEKPEEPVVEENKEEVNEETTEEKPIEEEVVEIREIESASLGLKEIDVHFPKGVPKICNMLFMGTMSTGKTLTALKLILEKAKNGEKAAYISLHDSQEKIINIMKTLDIKILDYVNSGNIVIKKLNPFEIVEEFTNRDKTTGFEMCCKFLEFVEVFGPSLVVVDSLSTLELSFGENKIDYRHYIDRMFKYFEKIGILAIFIKELKTDEDINKEFYENLLADIILNFYRPKGSKKSVSKLIKEYPIPDSVKIQKPKKEKKGLFSFLRKKK